MRYSPFYSIHDSDGTPLHELSILEFLSPSSQRIAINAMNAITDEGFRNEFNSLLSLFMNEINKEIILIESEYLNRNSLDDHHADFCVDIQF